MSTMARQARIYVFGDQSHDLESSLRALLRSKDTILTSFFERAYHALRAEVARLPLATRAALPRFSCIADLIFPHRVGSLNPALDKALAVIHQSACFISQHSEAGRPYPAATDSYAVGLCTGMLTAAAVGSSRSVVEFLPAAVHSAIVAFRTGLYAWEVGWRIEKQDCFTAWSMIVPGATPAAAAEAIEEFTKAKNLPGVSRPYISAFAPNGLTISGPPSVLLELGKSQQIARATPKSISIRAPYHAPHLFTKTDIDLIFEGLWTESWDNYNAGVPLFSSTTGQLLWASNFHSLLQVALEETLLQPISWENLVRGIVSCRQNVESPGFEIIPIATNADQIVYRALKEAASSRGFMDAPISVDTSSQNGLRAGAPRKYAAGRTDKSKIAIIGMSGRFPGADSVDAFWDLLEKGLDVCKEVPPLRWDVNTHVDPTGKRKNTSKIRWGCWLDNPEQFDARFFNISPREAPQLDPAQRLALLTAYEALEEAGVVAGATPSTEKDRVGVFYGTTSNDWCETNSAQDVDTYFIPGGNRAFIPGRINYAFGFSGPSNDVDTACSSSLAAIHIACNSLWRGDVDTAIAGGTNVLTNPDVTAGLDRGHFLSETGNSRTFDDEADGYCRGEGVSTVILKRLEDALADEDPIHGLISGAYTNHSAEAESITRPHVGAQKDIFRKILHSTGTDPYEVGYVECHGTGTQAGDLREMTSVLDTFAPCDEHRKRSHNERLYLGSLKSNIGHGEAASGVSSLIKVLKMMEKSAVPPHCGIKTRLNTKFPTDMKERNVHIAFEPTSWDRPAGGVRRAFVNNFSAAGGNSSILVEDPPMRTISNATDPRSTHVVTISAKGPKSLKGNLGSMLSYLTSGGDPHFTLGRLSYTTTARRMHYPHRVVICGSDIHQIKAKLQEAIQEEKGSKRTKAPPKTVFTFTGQGSQYPGMGKQLYENLSQFRGDIHRLDRLGQRLGFPSMTPMFTTSGGQSVDDYLPIVVQLAAVCMQIALARLWISWGIAPSAVVGHSLGEYAALNAAGVISESDTIYLVGKRAQLLQERCQRGTHSMLAVLSSQAKIHQLVGGEMHETACVNGPEETVLAGTNDQIFKLHKILSSKGVKATTLKVPFAFHSSQVTPILDDFEDVSRGVNFRTPDIPVICPLLGSTVIDATAFGPKYLSRHCREPVNMLGALQSARASGVFTDDAFAIEFGPHPVVSGMVKATLGTKISVFPSIRRNKDSWTVLTETLAAFYSAGADVRWSEYHRDFVSSRVVLSLPAYSWDLKPYWMQYVHDWSLRKGDAPLTAANAHSATIKPAEAPRAVPHQVTEVPKLDTTTVHRIIEEKEFSGKFFLVVESNCSRPDLNPMCQGHKVDGIPLCTPSVYADIAFTLGTYLLDRFQPSFEERLVDVANMVIEKALIARGGEPQMLRAAVDVDWKAKAAQCRFYSIDKNGKETGQHSRCSILFKDHSELNDLGQGAAHAKSRKAQMRESCGVDDSRTFRFNGAMAYNMVQSLADFHPDYRCIDETILDNKALEAACTVSFGGMKKGGVFHCHPAYIDGLTQSGGFIMNANDNANLAADVFVNHGWDSFQLFDKIRDDRQYFTHVQMFPHPDKVWKGDIIALDGDKIVASVKGVTLQGVQRRLLQYILKSSDTRAPSQPSVAKLPAKAANVSAVPTTLPPPTKSAAPREVLTGQSQSATASTPVIIASTPQAQSIRAQAAVSTQVETAKATSPSTKWNSAVKILSEESGVDIADFSNEVAFADVGIDSLLSLVIGSRFREELDLDLGDSMFLDAPTVKQFKDLISEDEEPNFTSTTIKVEANPSKDAPVPVEVQPTVQTTIIPSTYTAPVADFSESTLKAVLMDGSNDNTSSAGIFDAALQIISEESGISTAELTEDIAFADIGIDSLLSLVIGSRIREELSIDLNVEVMFIDYPTVGVLKKRLTGSPQAGQHVEDSSASSGESDGEHPFSVEGVQTPDSEISEDEEGSGLTQSVKMIKDIPSATSVMLQGSLKTAEKVVFLFPDGCGAASSYAAIARVSGDVALIGLNSPYLKNGQEMTDNIDELLGSYLAEVRRRQPKGPYHLGGWSAGGVLAYRATQILLASGEEVSTLVLIDSPFPQGLGELPPHFFNHCDKVGLFGQGTGKAPEWLVPHFKGTNRMLSRYYAEPLPLGAPLKISIIWAGSCVFDGKKFPKMPTQPGDPEDMKFLTEARTDASAGKWSSLFPGGKVVVEMVEEANHFTLLQGENRERIASFLSRALAPEPSNQVDDEIEDVAAPF